MQLVNQSDQGRTDRRRQVNNEKERIVSSSGRSIVQHCSILQKKERGKELGEQPPPIEDEGLKKEAHDDDGH